MSVNYSIIQSDKGNIAVQSTVQSFNLDHITEKDIVSFYTRFSQFSAWDTGLLPVDGSGILSIRTAGEYTQFAYQHSPGIHHVNWGKTEGSTAAAYYLAQPYRIIICDMKEGNLLGARMFYSPYPITNPTQPLYHVNLPNINCKGYRGNGVGWICLYQNEDWSHLPLNERIVRFIERCSGVETYNDANMSETDGTRFYQASRPSYFWDPVEWENKSSTDGYHWTLDPNLLIPVLVESMDSQGQHKADGVPLTFADALVGDYQAYYYDKVHTKPINAIIRPDKELDPKQVLSYFVGSYNTASPKDNPLLDNTFESSNKVKQDVGSTVFGGSVLIDAPQSHNIDEDEDEDHSVCHSCDDLFSSDDMISDHYDNLVCHNCISDNYIKLPTTQTYFHEDSQGLVYVEVEDKYYHVNHDSVETCEGCFTNYGNQGLNNPPNKVITLPDGLHVCPNCIEEFANSNNMTTKKCFSCSALVITDQSFNSNFISTNLNIPSIDFSTMEEKSSVEEAVFCQHCSNSTYICPCGILKSKDDEGFNPCHSTEITNDDKTFAVNKACASCVNFSFNEDDEIQSKFVPVSVNSFNEYHSSTNLLTPMHKGIKKSTESSSGEEYF